MVGLNKEKQLAQSIIWASASWQQVMDFEYQALALIQVTEDQLTWLGTIDHKQLKQPFHLNQLSKPILPPFCFAFSGQGTQKLGMAKPLYNAWPVFHDALETHLKQFESLQLPLETSIRDLLLTNDSDLLSVELHTQLNQTANTQLALVVFEVSLAKALVKLGMQPTHLIGHSIGEWSAAYVAGSVDFETLCRAVYARGQSMQSAEAGVMLAVVTDMTALEKIIHDAPCWISVENGPNRFVLSMGAQSQDRVTQQLKAKGIAYQQIPTSHAFHSPMMQAASKEFEQVLNGLSISKPKIEIRSTQTAQIESPERYSNPTYWSA
jgi:acyl transferase domain-containing protein